ncbi:MAG: hypothetical protein AMJ53_15300 [Gammaproteobacteria bacterium SG8_11]|nr:MAG: hypothetical protein AMJ53_15300 [Gammaproteobacteria bacterium SG8_11]
MISRKGSFMKRSFDKLGMPNMWWTTFFFIFALLLLKMAPVRWTGNEIHYFDHAWRFIAPERFSSNSAVFEDSAARILSFGVLGLLYVGIVLPIILLLIYEHLIAPVPDISDLDQTLNKVYAEFCASSHFAPFVSLSKFKTWIPGISAMLAVTFLLTLAFHRCFYRQDKARHMHQDHGNRRRFLNSCRRWKIERLFA